MANQSVQPIQIKSTPANHTGILYHTNYNQVHSGFATVNAVQKKEKASISSIFNWKKDKTRNEPLTSYQPQTAYPIQYAPVNYNSNFLIDSNRKSMHYNSLYKPDGYHLQQFPSTIHATIRYLPNHKQRTNILSTNWEPTITYPHPSNGQPITLQHEITYSEQITIAPSHCPLTHHPQCLTNQPCCVTKNQSCKCQHSQYSNKGNYFLIPTNSSLLESSTKLLNKSTDCMLTNKKNLQQSKQHGSIRGSKSHHNLNLDQTSESNGTLVNKKKSSKLASTVNERFLRIFKKSIKEPFSAKRSRKSILDCDLTAYDLVEENDLKENIDEVNDKLNIQKANTPASVNLDSSLEDEDRFENNFIQAKAKQKQHYYLPFKEDQQQINKDEMSLDDRNEKSKNNLNRKDLTTKLNKDDEEEDRWINAQQSSLTSTKKSLKFNSCRIAGQRIQFSKRMSILESDLSKEFLKEEQSEDEDQNRFNRYAKNFERLDKTERMNNKLNKFNDSNYLNNNLRVFSSSITSASTSSIPNLPDPDYDNDDNEENDDEDDRHTLTMFSRSTPDLDQTAEYKRCKKSTFTNTTSLYNLENTSSSLSLFKNRPLLPLPKTSSQQLIRTNSLQQNTQQSSSPSSSTYSSFNSSINSNVKSILKKSNPNLILFDHNLKSPDLVDSNSKRLIKRKDSKLRFNHHDMLEEEPKLTKRFSLNKSVSTFKSGNIKTKLDDYNKPKKQVHFRSSFNDELIVEHIDNQELEIQEEQIYDDILSARLMQSSNDSSDEENNELKQCNKVKKDLDKECFLKLENERSHSTEKPKTMISLKDKSDRSPSCSDKLNSVKERSYWENQSSQLPKVISNECSDIDQYLASNNVKLFRNTTRTDLNGSEELQSTALVKQNRKKILENSTNGLLLLRQVTKVNSPLEAGKNAQSTKFDSSFTNSTADKNLDLLESLTQSTNNLNATDRMTTQEQSNVKSNNSFKEDNLFNRIQTDNDQHNNQMSPSSSSTSAYVSLYASSSFSSASSSNYSGFNETNSKEYHHSAHSNDSSKKISRSAILDSLINRKHNLLLDKSLALKSSADEIQNKENKIVIDVSTNNSGNSGNYDSLNQSLQNEDHIYEELQCGFEREINIIDNVNNNLNTVKKSIFNGASKDEILGYLVDAKERIQELLINDYNDPYSSQQNRYNSLSTSCHNIAASNRANRRNRVSNLSNVSSDSSSSSDILITNSMSNSIGQHLELSRNDSGVGCETSKPSSLDIRLSKSEACLTELTELIDNHIVHFDDPTDDIDEGTCLNNKNVSKTTNDSGTEEQICADCDQVICAEINEQTGQVYPLLCTKCHKRRAERKEIISEFVETEFKYGRDLRIIREEFYGHIETLGLLTKDQLKSIFLNLDELIQVNSKFSEKLQDAIDIATEQGDEEYTTVNIGKIFMEFCDMMKSFETYCIKQASASRLLGQLEKEKELLRIFLRVSQMENTLLRRMNLSAFLMVPVQRVTKYPLLLNRLFKVTPYHHADRAKLKESQLRSALHLEQINQQTKDTAPNNNKIWRRISNLSNNSTSKRANLDELGDVKLKKFNSSVRDLFKAFKSRS